MTALAADHINAHLGIPPAKTDDRDERWMFALLLIGGDDLSKADKFWRKHTNPMFAGLLAHDGFTFNEQTQQYVRANGRKVTAEELRWVFLAFLASASDEMEHEAGRMIAGQVPMDEWVRYQAQAVKDLDIAAAAAGAGGLSRLTQQDLADVVGKEGESGLSDATARLERFSGQISADEAGTSERIIARSGMYSRPAYPIYQGAVRASHIRARDDDGKLIEWEELNVLGPAEQHCRSEDHGDLFVMGCIECTRAGWVQIASLPPIGERVCGLGCMCNFSFRVKPPNELSDATDSIPT